MRHACYVPARFVTLIDRKLQMKLLVALTKPCHQKLTLLEMWNSHTGADRDYSRLGYGAMYGGTWLPSLWGCYCRHLQRSPKRVLIGLPPRRRPQGA